MRIHNISTSKITTIESKAVITFTREQVVEILKREIKKQLPQYSVEFKDDYSYFHIDHMDLTAVDFATVLKREETSSYENP